VVERYARRRVVGVARPVAQGAAVINTAYVERLNATFRADLVTLVRRTGARAAGLAAHR